MKKIILLLYIVVGIVCSSKAQKPNQNIPKCETSYRYYNNRYEGSKREIGVQKYSINGGGSVLDDTGLFLYLYGNNDTEKYVFSNIPFYFEYQVGKCSSSNPSVGFHNFKRQGVDYIKVHISVFGVNGSREAVSSFEILTDELNRESLRKEIYEQLPKISGRYAIRVEIPWWVHHTGDFAGIPTITYSTGVSIEHQFNFSPTKVVIKKPINQIPSHVSWDVINKDASYAGVQIFITQKNIVNGKIENNVWACYNHNSNNFTSPSSNSCFKYGKNILDKDLRSFSLKDVPFKAGKSYTVSINPLVSINGGEALSLQTYQALITFNVPDKALIYKGLKFYEDDDSSVEASSENPLNLIDVGKKIRFKIAVINFGTILTNLKGTLTSTQSGVTILKNKVGFDSIPSQEKSFSTEEFEIIADDTVVPGTELLFDLSLKNGFNNTELAKTSLSFPIQPFISETDLIDDDGTNNSKGNDNKIFELGETIEYSPFVSNVSKHIFYGVIGTLNSNQSPVEVWHAKPGKSGRIIEKYAPYNSTSTGQAVSPGERRVQPINPFVIDYTGNTPLQNISFELQVEGNINIKEGTLMRCSALKTIKSEGEGEDDGSKEKASEIINLPITGNKIYTGQSFEINNNSIDFNMNSINQIEEGIFEIKKTVEGKLSVKAIKHGSYSFTIGAIKNGENRNYTYNITTNLKYGLEIIPTN